MRITVSFFRSLFLLLLLNLLVKPLWILGIDRKVQLLAGAEAYGQYFSAFSFVFIFSILADLGITGYVQRMVAYRGGIDANFLFRLLRYKLLLSIVATAVILPAGWLSGISNGWLLGGLLLLQLLWSWISFARAILSALQLYDADAWVSVADKLMLVLAGVLLLYVAVWEGISMHQFVLAQVVTAGITLIAATVIIGLHISRQVQTKGVSLTFRELLRSGLPFALLYFGMSLHMRADGFLLGVLPEDTKEAGRYASMFRFLEAGNMVATLVGGYLLAFWARHLRDQQLLQDSFNRIFSMMLSAAIGVAVLFAFYGQTLYEFFYGDDQYNAALLMRTGIAAIIPYFLVAVFGTMITAQGNIRAFLRMVLFAALINVVLNLLLIPVYGAMAAAVVAILSQSVMSIILMYYVRTQYRITVATAIVLRLALLLLVLLAAALLLRILAEDTMLQVIVFSAIWLFAGISLKLFPLQWLMGLQREK